MRQVEKIDVITAPPEESDYEPAHAYITDKLHVMQTKNSLDYSTIERCAKKDRTVAAVFI